MKENLIGFVSLQHTPLEKLDRKHFAKGPRGSEKNGATAVPLDENSKEIALIEAKMKKLCDLLLEVSTYGFPVFLPFECFCCIYFSLKVLLVGAFNDSATY